MSDKLLRIALGSDHGGLELKDHLKKYLEARKTAIDVIDQGTFSDESVDYPDFAEKVVNAIQSETADLGILCCGTGIGISMKANRYKGIRAAVVHSDFTAEMAKRHNNANILCFGGRTTDLKEAEHFVELWLSSDFEGGRHERRLNKLDQP